MNRSGRFIRLVIALLTLSSATVYLPVHADESLAVVEPLPYDKPLRNPLKGFRVRGNELDGTHPYATLARVYVPWNKLERNVNDGIDRIRTYSEKQWGGVEDHNIKVIPRVYLHWPPDKNHWPEDMETGDFSSDQFKRRVTRLIYRLGKVWDDDPRVAWVQMGLIGKWGEQHSPSPSKEMQQLLGRAFKKAFDQKHVTVRHPWNFKDFRFGIYWDSFAHIQQQDEHGGGIAKLGNLWRFKPIGGEVAYNWGRYKEQPGDDPNDTLRDPKHREWLLDTIRWLHASNLGWIAEYDPSKPAVARGAAKVQRAFGYRFVLKQVRYTRQIRPGGELTVHFAVKNVGSSPFYYNWPVAVVLLDADNGRVVWGETFDQVNPRRWQPGDNWDKKADRYRQPPKTYHEQGSFNVPKRLDRGKYVLALGVLDPAGMEPTVRFATKNYVKGGWHPIGFIGVGGSPGNVKIDPGYFDSLEDRSLYYEVK